MALVTPTVASTAEKQPLEAIRVYPGRDARFTLYDDDGTTNAYRRGGGTSAELVWDDSRKTLASRSKLPSGQNPAKLLQIIAAPAQ